MPLAVGTKAPDFTLPTKTADGPKQITLSENFGKRNTLLAFFPMAFTSTCTTEMCGLSSDLAAYAEMNAAVFGMSSDKTLAHRVWSRKQGIQNLVYMLFLHKIGGFHNAINASILPHIVISKRG